MRPIYTNHTKAVQITVKGDAWPLKFRSQSEVDIAPNIRFIATSSIDSTEFKIKASAHDEGM